MPRNSDLANLKNIAKKIAKRLNEVGIISEDNLRRVGAVSTHSMVIKEKHPNETSPVCFGPNILQFGLSKKSLQERQRIG